MPDTSAKLLDQLAVAEDARALDQLAADVALAPGTALPKPEGVFPRFQEDEN